MIEYAEDHDLEELVKQIAENTNMHELDPLREAGLTILSCMKTKMKDDELQQSMRRPAYARRISDLERVFVAGHWIIVMDYWAWKNEPQERERSVFSALLDIAVEPKDGGLKIRKRLPDVVEHVAVLKRYDWNSAQRRLLEMSTQGKMPYMLDKPAAALAEQSAALASR
jgi:hypothetical protein